VARGLYGATTEEGVIRRWWSWWPNANVAIRTGAASGLVVVDVDVDRGAEASLDVLVARYGPLPAGRVVRTGAGRHLYFAHPGGVVRNDAGRRLGPGLDVRGDGGYVLAPPARHWSGAVYEVAGSPTEIPPLPGWLTGLLRPPVRTRPAAPQPVVGHLPGWARAALAPFSALGRG